MSSPWPFHDLVLRTPRLELRPDDDAGLLELAAGARAGVHDPAVMPFEHPWTDDSGTEGFERGILQYHWAQRAAVTPDDWSLHFLVRREGRVVGVQSLAGRRFAVVREVSTGSWLTRHAQRQGVGTEMRAAVLTLVFDHLGARYARSGAFADNAASHRVSERLGYVDDGVEHHARRGGSAVMRRLRVDRSIFLRPAGAVTVDGLGPCLGLLGAG